MVKCVIMFGRIMKVLDQWKCSRRTIIFNVKKNKIMYKLKEFFGGPMGLLDLVVKFYFLNYLEQIKNSMCENYLQIGF